MIADLPVGRALRRFRLLNGIKQSHAAELLGVSQGNISRWESGTHEPGEAHRARITELIAAHASNDSDGALKRLVSQSHLPVHLVCDATHRLLAASTPRLSSWNLRDAEPFLGQSLWRFASPEIAAAEERLKDIGWYERPFQRFEFTTGTNGDLEIPVRPSRMEWETIPLADGRIGRLTTTVG